MLVKWKKNIELDVKNYKVYWRYVDPFTYSNSTIVPNTDTTVILNGASINDSIAVTALSNEATGVEDQLKGFESSFSSAVFSQVLPVQLLTFNGVAKGNKCYLTWQTAEEIQNKEFDIQLSIDGINFISLGSIEGGGTSYNSNTYSFVHIAPSGGVNYYRLKQVDKDGNFSFSNIVSVKFNSNNLKNIIAYPNPASDFINVASTVAMTHATLVNYLGEIIEGRKCNNSLQLRFDFGNIPGGIYTIIVTKENKEIETISFIKK